jgi:murein DD-endopeptidase MepM/ murein hydrolase activator NlpD
MKTVRMFAVIITFLSSAIVLADPAGAVVRSLCFPVEGGTAGATWTDTWGAARSGHRHQGQDLMSVGRQKMRPLLAAVDGTVREIVHQNGKGNRVVIQDDEGWFYAYLHVNNDTPGTDNGRASFEQAFVAGLHVGQRVSRCQPIAYMGDSGNAEGTSPHLHFEIRQPFPAGHRYSGRTDSWLWSSASAVNAADSLRAATVTQPGPAPAGPALVSAGPRLAPFTTAAELVERQYVDFYGRSADPSGAQYWTNRLSSGAETPVSMISRLLTAPEYDGRVAPLVRLHLTAFGRVPDTASLLSWVRGTGQGGATLRQAADAIVSSPAFATAFASVPDAAFAATVQGNALRRAGDGAAAQSWTDALASGAATRPDVLVGLSGSAEFRQTLDRQVGVVLAYAAMLERTPDDGGLNHWAARGVVSLVDGLYSSPEYAARVQRPRS